MRMPALIGCLLVVFSLVIVGCGGKSEEQQIEDELVALQKEVEAAKGDPAKAMEVGMKALGKMVELSKRIEKLPKDAQERLAKKMKAMDGK